METKLIFMEKMGLLKCPAMVQQVFEEEEKIMVILDQTVFYPQGGGQPYDQGFIESDEAKFRVDEVRFIDGLVQHMGEFESGNFNEGDEVVCHVNKERREHHRRLHSGGHVVDMALFEMGVEWKPSKGYHFPDGPYVEYEGSLEGVEKETFMKDLEAKMNEIIKRDITTSIQFMPKDQMHTVCHHVPDYLPEGKPARVVLYGDFGVPCGGTHVDKLKYINAISIRKIKAKGGKVKVGYNVE